MIQQTINQFYGVITTKIVSQRYQCGICGRFVAKEDFDCKCGASFLL